MADGGVTIIKKKKVVAGGGHHGGAWKVAYADFVTAMMAFFLLMWLLNATTENQKKGLADYFSPSIPVHKTSGGGDGPFTGDSVFSEEVMPQTGRGARDRSPTEERQAAGESGTSSEDEANDSTQPSESLGSAATQEDAQFELLQGMLLASSGESDQENLILQHIRTRVTDEGLVIELIDQPGDPLFEEGSDTPTEKMRGILSIIARVAMAVTNKVALAGHSFGSTGEDADSMNWQLSTNRVQQARMILLENGFDPMRVARVTGKADRDVAFDDPMDARNNRIEVILLR